MTVIADNTIRELAGFRSDGVPVTTCYLDVDGRRYTRPQDYEQQLDRMVREARNGPHGSEVEADLERIEAHVRAGLDRSRVRGLAMFSCAEAGLWQVIELPVSVRNRILVNAAPALSQIEQLAAEAERVAVVAVDKQRAQLWVFELGEVVHHGEIVDELPRDIDSVGHADHNRPVAHADEMVAQHLRHAARWAFEQVRDLEVAHVVLAVSDQLVAEFEHDLHPYVAERVRERIHARIDTGPDELRGMVLDLEHALHGQRLAEVVERIRAGVGSGGRAVAGLADTLAAIVDSRVDHLVVSSGFTSPGWRCAGCGYLASVGRTCGRCGNEMVAVDDVVEDAIDEAIVRGSRADVCDGNADLDVLGRIGATLRF